MRLTFLDDGSSAEEACHDYQDLLYIPRFRHVMHYLLTSILYPSSCMHKPCMTAQRDGPSMP